MQAFLSSRWRIIAILAAALIAALALAVAAFPYSILRPTIERRLSARFGQPVTIAKIERIDTFGFTPTLAIQDLRIPQPAWAEQRVEHAMGSDDFVRLDSARATIPILPLIVGSARPRDILVSGLRLALVRDADGRTNWGGSGDKNGRDRRPRELGGIVIRDAVIDYRDARRDRRIVAHVASDPTGVRVSGVGVIRGTLVRLAFAAPPIAGGRWPFTASLDGKALAMTAKGVMDSPLDTGAMTLDVTARARDLSLIDAVIEAGLFHTQPVALTAHLRRDAPKWTITALKGTIGRSGVAGALTVDKVDGRSKLDGTIRSAALDFDDLSSDEGLARGAALERRIGPRLVPDLRVDIGKIDTTDGTIRFAVDRILSKQGPPRIRAMRGVLTMDHRLMRVSPVTLLLARGAVTGGAIVDQHDGAPSPLVTLDLTLRNSDVASLVGGVDRYTGRVAGRARLKGRGDTLRAAVGASDGRIGFVIRDGALPERIAAALGFDALRTVLASGDERAGLRCVVAGLAVRHGRGRTDPLVVDTSESRLDGVGTVTFPSETLAIRLTGAPKHGGGLRLPGAVLATGTLKAPSIYVPPQVKSVGNILKAIGRAIKGDQGALATDADCGALAAKALS